MLERLGAARFFDKSDFPALFLRAVSNGENRQFCADPSRFNIFPLQEADVFDFKVHQTRPNEFGSMTARKDDILPLKTIKCDRKP